MNSETVRDRMSVTVITNRKSLRAFEFRLVPISMSLNDLERRNSPYFVFISPNSIALQTDYVTVVVDRRILSAKYCLSVLVFHFWQKLTHPAARSLCDSVASCVIGCCTVAWHFTQYFVTTNVTLLCNQFASATTNVLEVLYQSLT